MTNIYLFQSIIEREQLAPPLSNLVHHNIETKINNFIQYITSTEANQNNMQSMGMTILSCITTPMMTIRSLLSSRVCLECFEVSSHMSFATKIDHLSIATKQQMGSNNTNIILKWSFCYIHKVLNLNTCKFRTSNPVKKSQDWMGLEPTTTED